MYSTIDSVKNKMALRTLLELLNDESRLDDAIDLTNPSDLITIRFNQAASDAKEEIDPCLRARYALPLANVPKLITAISDDITIYNIYKRRMMDNMPESILAMYKNTVKIREQIQKGTLDLGIEKISDTQVNAGEFRVNKTASSKIFNDDMWSRH
jgi:phage gp36-like protein